MFIRDNCLICMIFSSPRGLIGPPCYCKPPGCALCPPAIFWWKRVKGWREGFLPLRLLTSALFWICSYLHSCDPPIIHGNLTCDTIFIQHNGLIKIGSGKAWERWPFPNRQAAQTTKASHPFRYLSWQACMCTCSYTSTSVVPEIGSRIHCWLDHLSGAGRTDTGCCFPLLAPASVYLMGLTEKCCWNFQVLCSCYICFMLTHGVLFPLWWGFESCVHSAHTSASCINQHL